VIASYHRGFFGEWKIRGMIPTNMLTVLGSISQGKKRLSFGQPFGRTT